MVELNDTPENDLPVAMPPGIPSEGLIREPNPKLFPKDVLKLYTVFDYRHAAAILATEFKSEFEEICRALRTFRFTDEQVKAAGGNESAIPKTFSSILRPMKWKEGRLNARLMVDEEVVSQDSHKIDYVKNRIAFALEWNNKDQAFDRDLAAFRAFFDYGRVSVGVLVTRDTSLVSLKAGRSGGCPVLAFGITSALRKGNLASLLTLQDLKGLKGKPDS